MTITEKDGKEIAAKVLAAISAGFSENNFYGTGKDLFAPNLSWDFSDGNKGSGTYKEYSDIIEKMNGALKIDNWATISPTVVVDTDNNRITMSGPVVFTASSGNHDDKLFINTKHTHVYTLDGNMKIVDFKGYWDARSLMPLFAPMLARAGIEMPPHAPKARLTVDEGEAFAAKYLSSLADGFANNTHRQDLAGLFVDNMSWIWSDGNGEGTFHGLMDKFETTWGFMASSWFMPTPTVVVDEDHAIVTISGGCVVNITGKLGDENNPVSNPMLFVMTLNDDKKCIKWEAYWDNSEPSVKAALAKVSARLATVKGTTNTTETKAQIAIQQ